MKSHIFGALTCATFALTFMAYLAEEYSHPSKIPAISTVDNQVVRADRAVAVGSTNCPWCDKLKEETIYPLQKEGFNVAYVDHRDWSGPKPSLYPTIYFMNGNDIVRTKVGFATKEQVKRGLK